MISSVGSEGEEYRATYSGRSKRGATAVNPLFTPVVTTDAMELAFQR